MSKQLFTLIIIPIFILLVNCSDDSTEDDTANGGTGGEAKQVDAGIDTGGATDNKTYIPHNSWTCGMPEGIPSIKDAAPVFDATFEVGSIYDIGRTQYGDRLLTEIKGGKLSGTDINVDFMEGGLDWQLTLENGVVEVEQVNVLQTADGATIYLRTCGVAPDSQSEVRVVADFEAPNESAYSWLNQGSFVGIRELNRDNNTLRISFYDVSGTAPSSDSVTVVEPEGITQQSWECIKVSGTPGEIFYTETVALDKGLIALGKSKRGERNIVPITGGTITGGRIAGVVLSGGADYQLVSDAGYELDARYTLRTDDGELIIVRNCGLATEMVPVFEAAIDGNYAWINENKWLSATPDIVDEGVEIVIYEIQ